MSKTITATYTIAQIPSFPADNPLSIAATGTISLASGGFALNLAQGDAWMVTNSGLIAGDTSGDYFSSNFAVFLGGGTLVNHGNVAGYMRGVYAYQHADVVNDGTIRATGTADRGAIYAVQATVTNLAAGFITGAQLGIGSSRGPITVVNQGTIAGGQGSGIQVSGALTLANDGEVLAIGASARAVYVLHGAAQAITNAAGGIISAAKYGVMTGPTSSGVIINAGTIDGATAVGIGAGDNFSVVVDPGAVFGGKVMGNAASTLAFAYGVAAGTFSGLGSRYTGFGAVDVAAGGRWYAVGTNIAGGSLTVAGVLENTGSLGGGIVLTDGGYVSNAAGGTIAQTLDAPALAAGAGRVGAGNHGLILDSGGGYAVSFAEGGGFFNYPAAAVLGAGGIALLGTGAVLDNFGLIAATGAGAAIDLGVGGELYDAGTIAALGVAVKFAGNDPGNRITFYGYQGVEPKVVGTVAGDGGGMVFASGVHDATPGTYTLDATGARFGGFAYATVKSGPQAWRLLGYTVSGTFIDAGTIAGGLTGDAAAVITVLAGGTISSAGDAVLLAGGRLVVEPGAVFQGAIDGGGAGAVLEFGAGFGTASGTFAGFGSTVVGFEGITLDAGARWLLAGSAEGFGGGETISGLAAGGTIELAGTVESYGALAGGMLTLSGGTTLDLPGVASVVVGDDDSNTFITACFANGTGIEGEFGQVPVEALRVGDLVLTVGGRLAPILWLGHRGTDLSRHPCPHDVMPVRIRAGAFGPGQPRRDLVLSPDHAVFAGGVLIPIRHLINGQSIVQERRERITYWHLELGRHDVILAEDLPCETYLDTGNRHAFAGEAAMAPRPGFDRDHALAVWRAAGCAPILTDGADATLRALHLRLLARAGVLQMA
jgi:hypothetical protein